MRMAARLGAECRQRRGRSFTLMDVAVRAGVSQGTVHHFEDGDWWVRRTDEIVDAYAELLSTTPGALWRAALDRKE